MTSGWACDPNTWPQWSGQFKRTVIEAVLLFVLGWLTHKGTVYRTEHCSTETEAVEARLKLKQHLVFLETHLPKIASAYEDDEPGKVATMIFSNSRAGSSSTATRLLPNRARLINSAAVGFNSFISIFSFFCLHHASTGTPAGIGGPSLISNDTALQHLFEVDDDTRLQMAYLQNRIVP
jgi:hypothetical protein